MDGGVLGEFSSVGAANRGAPPMAGGAQKAGQRGPPPGRNQGERLLQGEFGDESQSQHYIEDQSQIVGIRDQAGQILSEVASKEEREKLLRRLEMCARAREESTKIMSMRFAQRDQVKQEQLRVRRNYLADLHNATAERSDRWARKMQKSPFAVDLVAENQRIDEENRVRDHIEQRKQKLMHQRNREAHNAIFKRAVAESDELDVLRQEKRTLLHNEKLLTAMRDVERSNARTAQILQERRRNELERQQAKVQEALVG